MNLPEKNDYAKLIKEAFDLLKDDTGVNGIAHPCGWKTESLTLGTGEVVKIGDKVWVQRRVRFDNCWKLDMTEDERIEFYKTADVLATVYNFYSVNCVYCLDLQFDDTKEKLSIHPSMFSGQVRKA